MKNFISVLFFLLYANIGFIGYMYILSSPFISLVQVFEWLLFFDYIAIGIVFFAYKDEITCYIKSLKKN